MAIDPKKVQQIDTERDLLKSLINKKDKTMPKKKTLLQRVLSIKDFIKVRDENGNIDKQEIIATAIQLGLGFAVVWGAVELGIWEQVSEFIGASE